MSKFIQDPSNNAIFIVGESGKRHLLPAEWAAYALSGEKPISVAHDDIAAIPDAPTLPLSFKAGTVLTTS